MGIAERKEREKVHRKKDILKAAKQVFFEKGLALATMDEIAERAELSKGTLYLYYNSKEDLYLAVMCNGFQKMYEMCEKMASTGQPSIKLFQNLGEALSGFLKQYPHYCRMFAVFQNGQLHSQISPEMLAACAAANQRIQKLVTNVIQKGIQEGSFRREINPMEVGIMLWSHTWGIANHIDRFCRENKCLGQMADIDYEKLLFKSQAILLYAILTDEARKNFKLELSVRPNRSITPLSKNEKSYSRRNSPMPAVSDRRA